MENIENQEVKTKRQSVADRLKSRYPDKSYEDDEELFGQINDDYDEYDKSLNSYKEHEKNLTDMFASDPRSAAFLSKWKDGGDPVISLVQMFGTDIKDAIDDPAKQEEIAKANKEFVERVAKEKELEEEYQKNLDESLKNLDDLQAQNGLTDEQVDEVMAYIAGIVKDGIVGKFTTETINMALKALNHDADVSNAAHEAEVRGKNAKIEEKLRKNTGDGLPSLGGKNGGGGSVAERPSLGALDRFGDNNKTIFERGNEKRTRYY